MAFSNQQQTTDDFGDDGMEHQMSMIGDVLEQEARASSKRKSPPTDVRSSPKVGGSFASALYMKVYNIDGKKELCVYDYFDRKDDDPVVSEYIENLIQLGFVIQLPELPTEDNPNKTVHCEVGSEISVRCRQLVTPLLMSYFQTRNFNKNMSSAIEHKKVLANPQMKLFMPAFQFSPLQNLEDVTQLKQMFALKVQELHCKSAEFIAEFLILRAGVIIHNELKETINDTAKLKSEVQNHFSVMYLKCLLEFTRKFRGKETNFADYESKLRHSESKWRKTEGAAPPLTKNHYATDFIRKLEKNEVDLRPGSVAEEFNNFMKKGNMPLPPPPAPPRIFPHQHHRHTSGNMNTVPQTAQAFTNKNKQRFKPPRRENNRNRHQNKDDEAHHPFASSTQNGNPSSDTHSAAAPANHQKNSKSSKSISLSSFINKIK